MTRNNLLKLARSSLRSIKHQRSFLIAPHQFRTFRPINQVSKLIPSIVSRSLSTTSYVSKGISPETDNPQPKEPESSGGAPSAPTEISMEEYHQVADECMDTIVAKLEQLQEAREDVDVEYSAGVLTLNFPPNGTYVLNKQPPNKQIWLSSPISGPKRYDWVMLGEGQHEKEGSGRGDWVYLRDQSTLADVLLKELQVDLTPSNVE